MKVLAIIAIFVIVGQAQDKTPPVWPEVFTSRIEVNGKLFYDSNKRMIRVDRGNGQWDQYCGPSFAIGQCTQLTRDQKRYLYSTAKRQCCICCDEFHGCGVTVRDWLRFASYQGTQNILGQAYDKWFLQTGPIIGHYYATQTSDKIPKRFSDASTGTLRDYVKISYSIQAIPQSTFSLPSYCQSASYCNSAICTRHRTGHLTQQ